MNFTTEFTPLALRTESNIAPITFNKEIFDSVLEASIIIGKLADFVKKNIAYNKPINTDVWNNLVNRLDTVIPELDNVNTQSFLSTEDTPLSTLNTRLFHGIIGSFTESAELMEAMQKAVDTGKWDYTNIKEEIADTQWYAAVLLNEIEANMDDVLSTVIKKLQKRYPEKYSDAQAINRDVAAERIILEE